jgi:high-affinity nickel-transport protein
MGNFSVNHYSGIRLTPTSLELRYLIDMAEIPTFQELQAAGLKADLQDPRLPAYLSRKVDEFRQDITLKLDGKPVEFECRERQVIFPPGAGGLPTMKFGFTCITALAFEAAGQHRLEYRDDNFQGRAGWKEVIVDADPSLQLSSTAPSKDRSNGLSNYPTDLLNSPPQDLTAEATFTVPTVIPTIEHSPRQIRRSIAAPTAASSFSRFSVPASKASRAQPLSGPDGAKKQSMRAEAQPSLNPGSAASTVTTGSSEPAAGAAGAVANLAPNAQATPRSAFTQLVTTQKFGFWFFITAAFISMTLGGLHALEPGHGKTLVAAYLVGSRGSSGDAVLLGAVATLAHTAGVYALGAVTLYASRYVVPDKLYPWLGAISGLIIVGLGLLLLLRRWTGEVPGLNEDHRHWHDRLSDAAPAVAGQTSSGHQQERERVSLRQLLLLGITGGIVPCPAALVVLLSAIALRRIALGFFLIVAFSFGLAAVLIAIGLAVVRAGRLLARYDPASKLIRRQLPLVSAAFIIIIGVLIVLQSIKISGSLLPLGTLANPKWLLIAGIGLLLGMRHSTDPDHVIAVTTIVTRLGSVRHASLVGMLWGVGHTLTIFLVGSAIIIFGIVIPPRIGLSMEFAVALMLILLGILNLTGVLAWLTRKFTPPPQLSAAVPGAKSEGRNTAGLTQVGKYHLLRPLAIGIVHGLAGSAAVALLVLATIHNPVWAIGYLLLFGMGTIAGMMIMTAVIAMPVVWSGKNFLRLNRYMCATSGIVSLAFGLFLVYQIGFVSGLFTAVPKWIPE